MLVLSLPSVDGWSDHCSGGAAGLWLLTVEKLPAELTAKVPQFRVWGKVLTDSLLVPVVLHACGPNCAPVY